MRGLGPEDAFEASACPVEADSERGRCASENLRRFPRAEAIPCRKKQRLLIGLRQLSERLEHRVRPSCCGYVRATAAHPSDQSLAPAHTPSLVREGQPCDPEQPAPRRTWSLRQTPPGNKERLGGRIVGGVGRSTPSTEREHVRPELAIEPVEGSMGFVIGSTHSATKCPASQQMLRRDFG